MLRFQDMDIDLTQRKDVFAWIIGLTFLVALAYATYSILAPFVQALVWAGVFASLMTPLQRRLAKWIPSDGARAGITCLVAIVALFIPLAALGAMLTAQLVSSAQSLQLGVDNVTNIGPAALGLVERLQVWLTSTFGEWASIPAPDLKASLLSVAERLSQWLLSNSSVAAGNIAAFGFGFFVMVMGLFYFLRDGDQLVRWIVDLFPARKEQKHELLEKLGNVVATLRGDGGVPAADAPGAEAIAAP
jgi:predicted PurR-regulated permease PerM